MILKRICVAASIVAFGSGSALHAGEGPHGAVEVEFVNAEKFTDASERSYRTRPDRNPNLRSLRKYLETRAVKHLAPGQNLKIEFTDIDLAGDFRPQIDPALHDVRLVTRLYPPRLEFNYVLSDAGGATISSGHEKLRDIGFDMHSSGNSSDALRHEKRLLAKWMREKFGR